MRKIAGGLAVLMLTACSGGPSGSTLAPEPVRSVLIVDGDLPRQLDVIDRGSTGRSVAVAIGSAVPLAGLFADAAARRMASQGATRREEELAAALGSYDPGERLLSALEAEFAGRSLTLTVLDEEREPLSGEVLLRVDASAFGLTRDDKESAYRPALDARISAVTEGGRRVHRVGCEKGRGQRILPCPDKLIEALPQTADQSGDVIGLSNALAASLAAELARSAIEH
ncbi:hypothetical protein [Parvularcula maris]|uniref:Lipoprotein n=1 Tax=Parvularcula maris TaxID=2965077 RepID=A0A9X2L820_9PROT|nr:hypothetical protein [Parvularcula maris]MCQ8184805.1 hypothetical protein [Parvularcula maris]